MNATNALGLKMVGLTSAILLLLGGLWWGGRYLLRPDTTPAATPLAQGSLPNERTDSDGDGLPDKFESIYRTDPHNPDTDGDGVSDYDEIAQGRDPAVAGTQDEVKPATGENITALTTFTERYLAQLPTAITRDDIMQQDRLEAFVSLNKGPLLSTRPSTAVHTSPATGQEAVESYLNSISAVHNAQLQPVTNADIQQAVTLQLQGQPDTIVGMTHKLEKNLQILQGVAAPTEVVALHTKLLAATESLLGNTRLLADMKNDFVGGLIGSKNIEELGPVFQQITQEVQALETKYGLE
ncbi:MAG: hypothetical protein WEA04_01665 [Candidatus Andersenbacteria bacterium]